MNIYQGDLNTIMGANAGDLLGNVPGRWNAVPSVGSIIMTGVGGILAPAVSVIELEITLLDAARRRIIPWTRVQASVNSGVHTPGVTHRLDGPWLRSLLFIGSAPDNNLNRQVIFSTCKSMGLPALNVARVPRLGMAYGAGFFAPPVVPVQLIATPGVAGVPPVAPAVPPAMPMPLPAVVPPGPLVPVPEPMPAGVPASLAPLWGPGPAGPYIPPPGIPMPPLPAGIYPVGGPPAP